MSLLKPTRSEAAHLRSARRTTRLRFEALEQRALLTLDSSGNGNTDSASLVAAGGPGASGTIGFVNVGESSTHNASVIYLGNRWCLTANHVTLDNNVGLIRFGVNSYTVDMSSIVQLTNTDSVPTDLKVFRLTTDPGLPAGMTPGLPWILPSRIVTATPSGRQIMIGNGLSTNGLEFWHADKTQNPWVWTTQTDPLVKGPDDYKGFDINTSGRAIRWGENDFDSTLTVEDSSIRMIGYTTTFDDLKYTLTSPLPSEAQASSGDSGGAVFTMEGGQWKLGGVIDLISDPLSGQPANTAIFGDSTFMVDLSKYRTQILSRVSSVASRQLFYRGSAKWDVTNGATFSDDNAIAPDKTAYLPGSTTSDFSAVSSYSKGINGLMVDLYSQHGAITANDFIFKIGNNNSPSSWAAAPAPITVTTRAGAGVGGTDRVEIMWNDGAIQGTWLEVIVRGNDTLGGSDTNTGLAASDVFYFGSAPGDAGAADGSAFSVSSADEISARNDPHGIGNPAPITNVNDFNRDGLVNSTDQIFARNNVTTLLTQLKFLAVGSGGPFAPSNSPAVSAESTDLDKYSGIATALSLGAAPSFAPAPMSESGFDAPAETSFDAGHTEASASAAGAADAAVAWSPAADDDANEPWMPDDSLLSDLVSGI